MLIVDEPGKSFEYYVRALRGQFDNDLSKLIMESDKEIFLMRKNPTTSFMIVPHNKLQIGKFYLINYNYNGNKLYCPILTIDYRVSEKGKHVLYALNLDYLPFDYKLLYFNELHNSAKDIFDNNSNSSDFMAEQPLPINFEMIYKTLESNGGYNYAISAFDVTKIVELFGVSTKLMYLIIHIHMRPVNISLMKEMMNKYENGTEEKNKLNDLVNKLEEMSQTYDDDVQLYYKKLRNLESNYKLLID